jgi:hypothetical protein
MQNADMMMARRILQCALLQIANLNADTGHA